MISCRATNSASAFRSTPPREGEDTQTLERVANAMEVSIHAPVKEATAAQAHDHDNREVSKAAALEGWLRRGSEHRHNLAVPYMLQLIDSRSPSRPACGAPSFRHQTILRYCRNSLTQKDNLATVLLVSTRPASPKSALPPESRHSSEPSGCPKGAQQQAK